MADQSKTVLAENESVLYKARPHWVLLLGPAMLLIMGGLSIPAKGLSALLVCAIAVAWGVFCYRSYNNSEIRLTDKRVLVTRGGIYKRTYDIQLAEISLVDSYQPSLGAILNFGKITIIHGNKFKSVCRMIASPVEFVTKVKQQAATIQNPTQAEKK